jgi:hypothetical protein
MEINIKAAQNATVFIFSTVYHWGKNFRLLIWDEQVAYKRREHVTTNILSTKPVARSVL